VRDTEAGRPLHPLHRETVAAQRAARNSGPPDRPCPWPPTVLAGVPARSSRVVRIGRIARITVEVHALWLAVLPLMAGLLALRPQPDMAARLAMASLPLVGALCVLLHEAGHALAGLALGLPVRRVALLPAGGATQFARQPRAGREELLTSIAGPAVSLLIVALAAGAGLAAGAVREAAWSLALFNVAVFVANALPALPLDGGRAMRAFLCLRGGDHARAAALVGRIGATCGYALGVLAGAAAAAAPGGRFLAVTITAALGWTGWVLMSHAFRAAVTATGGRTAPVVRLPEREPASEPAPRREAA
jgi:Zn-dependent protease